MIDFMKNKSKSELVPMDIIPKTTGSAQANPLIGATGQVRVKGIYVMNNPNYMQARYYRLINLLASLNRVPVLYVRQGGPIYTAPEVVAKMVKNYA